MNECIQHEHARHGKFQLNWHILPEVELLAAQIAAAAGGGTAGPCRSKGIRGTAERYRRWLLAAAVRVRPSVVARAKSRADHLPHPQGAAARRETKNFEGMSQKEMVRWTSRRSRYKALPHLVRGGNAQDVQGLLGGK